MSLENKVLIGKDHYLNIKSTVNKYSKELISEMDLLVFNNHIDEKLADFNPSMMVYGTYNAGKSSLLNALFGQKEKAKTGDSPETAEVYKYQYNGYTIYDTPGMNAPIEHEKITNEHLQKTEMVIFVISNDGSLEEEYVYQRISEIVKTNKPLIIVLNNKRGIDINSKEALDEIDKVNINLSKIGDRNGINQIEKKISLCMVNARSALKGKLENKKLILQKSNLLQLENIIDATLSESGSNEVLNALNLYIKGFIDKVIIEINENIDNPQVKKIEELITYLEKMKKGAYIQLYNGIDKQIKQLSGELERILLSDRDLEKKILSSIEENVNTFSSIAENSFNKTLSDLITKIDDFSVEFKEMSINSLPKLSLDEPELSNEEFILPTELSSKVQSALRSSDVIEEGAKKVLILAKKYLPKSVMHGKGPVWIDKIAGKAGPVINVAIAAYDVYSACKEQQQMIERERNRVLGARNMANKISEEVKIVLVGSVNEVLSEIFDNLIINYKKSSEELSIKNKILLNQKNRLSAITTLTCSSTVILAT